MALHAVDGRVGRVPQSCSDHVDSWLKAMVHLSYTYYTSYYILIIPIKADIPIISLLYPIMVNDIQIISLLYRVLRLCRLSCLDRPTSPREEPLIFL